MALLTTGCQVTTTVTVAEPAPGRGSVTVAVVLDPGAMSAIGGIDALRSELSVSDLRRAGWTVSGPTGRIDGSAAVSVSHAFGDPAEVGPLMDQIAGAGVFKATLARHRSFWHTTYTLSGSVDLRCGVDCFGDEGLKSATGYPLGFDSGALASGAHQAPDSALTFRVDGLLPGRPTRSNGSPAAGDGRSWTPKLGQLLSLSETSQTVNRGSVVLVASLAGSSLVLVLAGACFLVIGRARRRRRRGSEAVEKAPVTP